MAKKEATLLLKIKETGSKALTGIKKGFAALKTSALAVVAAVALVGAAIGKLALDADKFNSVKTAFTNLAEKQGQDANKMLDNMRRLSKGTVADLELMKQANNALLLGLPVDRFGDMLEIARSSAKATGQSMEFMLSSIVTGLGRGSKLVLDNLGIVFDVNKAYEEWAATLGKTASQLTDVERKQAFINKALEIGKRNAEAAGDGAVDLNDQWEQFKTTVSNVAIAIGQKLVPTLKNVLAISNVIGGAVSSLFKEEKDDISKLNNEIDVLVKKKEALNETLKTGKGLWDKLFTGSSAATKRQIELIDEEIAANQKLIDSQKKRAEDEAALAAKKRAAFEEAQALAAEDAIVQKELDDEKKAQRLESEAIFEQMKNDIFFQAQMAKINQEIANETNRAKKLELIKKKESLQSAKFAEIEKQRASGLFKFKQLLNTQEVSNLQSVFGQVATLSSSHNKKLAAIGKAAGIANAIINTARGVTLALATFPPPLSFALAGAVGAAGAAQIATISGVKLADGGIVKASQGGTPAIIGEGGQDEAVIPLEDGGAGGIGTTINLTVNGGMLGTESEARQFAEAVDSELFELRRRNESLAFDEDFT